MAEDQNKPRRVSVFQGVIDAINGSGVPGDKYEDAPAIFTPKGTGGLIDKSVSSIENIQNQFLHWQVQKTSKSLYTRALYFDTDRISAYQDFRSMDMSPEIAAALNIITDECITRNAHGHIMDIYSENDRVKDALSDLFLNRMNVEYNLRLWIRDLIKYGDEFIYLHVDKDRGIYGYQVLPAEEVHREEGYDDNPTNVRLRWETQNLFLEQFQFAHLRLLLDSRKIPYGRSILDPARKLWKQLELAEDSMLVYRTTRAPERRIFYIDVGNLEQADVKQYMTQIQNQVKKNPTVDSRNGMYNQKFDPVNITEDYWIPVRNQVSSKIDTLPGACLALNTKIELLDGRSLPLSEIIEEHAEGKQLWTYSINPTTGEIVPGKITNAAVTRKNAEVLKVTLDNGEEIVCTPDHKFDVRVRGIVQAKDLQEGDSLWSFNRDLKPINNSGKCSDYEVVYDHQKNKYIFTHRMVAEYMKEKKKHQTFVFNEEYKNSKQNTVHHKNFNHLDNSPENLMWMAWLDHTEYHTQTASENFKKYYENRSEEKAKEHSKNISEGRKKYLENLSEEEKEVFIDQCNEKLAEGRKKAQELYKDPEFIKMVGDKVREATKEQRASQENRERCAKKVTEQWKDPKFRETALWKMTFLYTDKLFELFKEECIKYDYNFKNVENSINNDKHPIWIEFVQSNQHVEKIKKFNGFDVHTLGKIVYDFGYKTLYEFRIKNRDPRYFFKCNHSELLDNMFVDIMKENDFNYSKVLNIINDKNSEFFKEYYKINKNRFTIKKRKEFCKEFVLEFIKSLGYENHCDFKFKTLGLTIPKYKNGYVYSDNMLKSLVSITKENNGNIHSILNSVNSDCDFKKEFVKINKNHSQFKRTTEFTIDFLRNFVNQFGYYNIKDFVKKTAFYNHKIVKVEYLPHTMDTGTITVDGNEELHNFHNFALTCGVFTRNSNLDAIQDIQYLQNKLFAALQVPKTYLNYAENLPGGSTLSQADLRFARTINGIQEVVLAELRRVANIHLYFLGLKDDINNFRLALTNPSTQQELLKLETMKARLEVWKESYGGGEANSPYSWTWAHENILGTSKSDIKLILKQKKVEKKIFTEIDSAVETYKKIGVFKDLDAKYELPGITDEQAAQAGAEAAGKEGGGGGEGGPGGSSIESMLGGGGGGPEGGAPSEEAGAPGGEAAAPPAETAPLAESVQSKKLKKVLSESDRRMNDLMDELLGTEEQIHPRQTLSENTTNSLLDSNKLQKDTVNAFLTKMDESIGKLNSDTKNEIPARPVATTLFENNAIVIERTNAIIKDIEASGVIIEEVDKSDNSSSAEIVEE